MHLELLVFCLSLSKVENRLQRRPRSTSMKDRQNSKAQSDRTSSMESECSPDSRLVAQVNNSHMCSLHNIFSPVEMWWLVPFSDTLLLICLKGSQEVCVWPAEPDPHLWRTPTWEHHPHQYHGVARTGVCFSIRNTSIINPHPSISSYVQQKHLQKLMQDSAYLLAMLHATFLTTLQKKDRNTKTILLAVCAPCVPQ